MKLKFHGARGSYPTPTAPERIEELTKNLFEAAKTHSNKSWAEFKSFLKAQPRSFSQIYGGHSTCVEVSGSESPIPIFFDAGTGITAAAVDPQSALNNAAFKSDKGKVALFMTHTHWDHIMGLPNIAQLYRNGNEFHVYGVHKKLSERLSVLFQSEYFPVPYQKVEKIFQFHQIEVNQVVTLGDLKISHFAQSHPGGSFAYRLQSSKKSLVFATDTELKNISEPHMKAGESFYSDADLLVLDAHFSPEDIKAHEGWGHASIHAAVDFAVRERVRKLYLFHQNPLYSDAQIDEQFEKSLEYKKKSYSQSGLQIFMTIEGEEVEV